MVSTPELRSILLYEFKLGSNATETARNINIAFGDGTVNIRTVQRWFTKFRSGDTDLRNEARGKPGTVVEDDHLRALVEADPSRTLKSIAEELNVSCKTIGNKMKTIGKVKKLQKWVPHLLTENQKLQRFQICSSHRLRNNVTPFLRRIVTCDEKWVMYENRKRSGEWVDRDGIPGSVPKPSLHQKKVMVTVWWTVKGVVHYSFLEAGQTINAESYCHEIEEMHRKLFLIDPALINRHGPILLHDNARPHIAKKTFQKLNDLGYEILQHPSYSPDLSPTDFHLFRSLEHKLRNKIFRNLEEFQKMFSDFVESKDQDFFETGISSLENRWGKCIEASGDYFD